MYAGLAEYFHVVVYGQQNASWKSNLPQIPLTTGDLKKALHTTFERDELRVKKTLAELGSVSASIIFSLRLTRTIVKEAMDALRDNRAEQQNLLSILGASRYEMAHGGGMWHTVCPRNRCVSRDTFCHTLECYGLLEAVRRGSEAVPFLIEMAKKTLKQQGKKLIPYPEPITAETKIRDSAQTVIGVDGIMAQSPSSASTPHTEQ